MGCQQGKSANANNSVVRTCLQEIDQIIKSIESLNAFYLEDNKIAFKIDPSIHKVEEFVKYAYQHHTSESNITSTTTHLQTRISYDDYTKQLIHYQQTSRSFILKGFALYEQGQQIQKSPIIQTLLQKLVLLQNFSLKLKIPKVSNEICQEDLEKKLQILVKQITQSQEIEI